ncbi:hypothetical protein ACFOGI_00290 [Virgibacillus xinjiangensis]|uniref:DUF4306 domain-containing protein n=1 Tax=Virgibacillus xinjiangensis TaxID=393090 RepID=A0ABV7CQK0_9BACI
MQLFTRAATLFMISFLLVFGGVGIYAMTLDLEPGESIGKGWHLIKSHAVEYEVVNGTREVVATSIQVGSGMVNISFLLSSSLTILYLFVFFFRKSGRRTASGQ